MSLMNSSVCPFEKQEVICKICEETDGAMESIFCEPNDHRLLEKIFKSTNVKVKPVCGMISPICEYCRLRIDQFDDTFQPRCQEYVLEKVKKLDPDDDPFNCLDPCGTAIVETKPVVKIVPEEKVLIPEVKENSVNLHEFSISLEDTGEIKIKVINMALEEPEADQNDSTVEDEDSSFQDMNEVEDDPEAETTKEKRKKGRPKVDIPLTGLKVPSKCEICGKTVAYMKDHMRMHDVEKKLKCPHCDQTFTQRNNLIYHVRKQHTGEKPFACDQCDKTFICKAHLLSHSRSHVNDKPFQCEVCSKRFNQACNLTKHLRVHTGEKPYSCSVCNKAFMNLSNMKAHEKRHYGYRNFTCEICSKSFYDNHHLERHMATHSTEKRRFQCDRCPKVFSSMGGLKAHLARHDIPAELISCDQCDLSFPSLGRLKIHQKRHEMAAKKAKVLTKRPPKSEEKSEFTCDVCPKRFTRSDRLEQHRQRVHVDRSGKKPTRGPIIDPETAMKQLTSEFEEPFICDVCYRLFDRVNQLKNHLKKHLEPPKEARKSVQKADEEKEECVEATESLLANETQMEPLIKYEIQII